MLPILLLGTFLVLVILWFHISEAHIVNMHAMNNNNNYYVWNKNKKKLITVAAVAFKILLLS